MRIIVHNDVVTSIGRERRGDKGGKKTRRVGRMQRIG